MLMSTQFLLFLISNRSGPHSSNLIFLFKNELKKEIQMILPNLSTHFAFLCLVWLWLSHEDWIHDNIYWDCCYCFWNAFLLQGNSIVGPTTSFMYSNPQWIVNGKWISLSGIIILVVGIGISLRRLRS